MYTTRAPGRAQRTAPSTQAAGPRAGREGEGEGGGGGEELAVRGTGPTVVRPNSLPSDKAIEGAGSIEFGIGRC